MTGSILTIAHSGDSTAQRTEALVTAIKEAVYEGSEGMLLANVIGAIECAKFEILRENEAEG